MLKIVGDPQEYVYIMSRADFGVNKSQYACIPLYFTPLFMYMGGDPPM